MKKILTPFLIALMIVFSSCTAFAASISLNVDTLAFNAEDKQDVMGAASSLTADGKKDASFTLAVSGAQAIKAITLKNETTGKMWSTSPSGSAELLLVKDSGGSTLNSSGRLPIIPVLLGADFKLFINDAQASIPKDSTFVVAVKLIDNKEVTGKTTVKGLPQTATTTTPAATATTPANAAASDGITVFESNGIGENDFAGLGEKVGADGKDDFQFTIKLNFADANVKGIKLTATAGSKKAGWDTVPGNKLPVITLIDSGSNLLNKMDGSVSFQVKGTSSYIMLVQDVDGILTSSDSKAKVVITLSDGRMYERDAVKGKTRAAKDSLSVEYKGTGKYDFVSDGEKFESNLNADRQINATLNADGTVTGVRVKYLKSGKIWDTVAGNKNPLVAVTNEKGDRQNKSDGTISMPVSGNTDLILWIDEEDDNAAGPYSVTFVLSNGQVLEASTAASGSTSKPAAPAAKPESNSTITEEDRDISFLSIRPSIVNLDMVGKNKKKGASGAKDTALNIQVAGKGRITNIVLVNAAGKGWDTLPSNNGRWLLGVREGSKFLNNPNGKVNFPVNGVKRYQLLMQDNGSLAAKKGKLYLSVTWGDGEVTETTLNW